MKKATTATPQPTPEEERAQFKVLSKDTMAGDLRDFVLETFKNEHSPLPWHMRKQEEQRAVIERVTKATEWMATHAVEMISAEGRRTMQGTLVKIVSKGNALQTQVDFVRTDPLRHELFDAQGTGVLLVIADPERFMGARAEVPINYDQGAMFNDDPKSADLDKRKPPKAEEPPPEEEPPPPEEEPPPGDED